MSTGNLSDSPRKPQDQSSNPAATQAPNAVEARKSARNGKRRYRWGIPLLGALVLVSGLAFTPSANLFEVTKNLDIYTAIFRELNTYYVDEVDPNKLMREGIDAMLESLDPYTTYISEAEMEGHRFQMTGRYGGIGAIIRTLEGQIVVMEPYENFPANKAGLQAGDVILEIDGKSTEGKNTNDISDILRGAPGSDVLVKVRRPFAGGTRNQRGQCALLRHGRRPHRLHPPDPVHPGRRQERGRCPAPAQGRCRQLPQGRCRQLR
jgi:hypothetical protein